MSRRVFITLPAMLLLIVAITAATVFAQATPAGTQIRNRSSATYQDMGGNNYSATSNEVITIVLPVFGVSILPDDSGETPQVTPAMAQNALPGMTVYYRYDLTNTGNDDDDFTPLEALLGHGALEAVQLPFVVVLPRQGIGLSVGAGGNPVAGWAVRLKFRAGIGRLHHIPPGGWRCAPAQS